MTFPCAESVLTIELGDIGQLRQRPLDFLVKGYIAGDDFRKSPNDGWTSFGKVVTADVEIVTCYFDLIEVR